MVQTRSQARGGEKEPAPSKPVKPTKVKAPAAKKEKGKEKAVEGESKEEKEEEEKEPEPEKPKKNGGEISTDKIHQLIAEHGKLPFHDTKLPEPDKPTPATMLAHVIDALLKSTRISHHIADETMKALIDAGYQDVKTLQDTSWEERRDILESAGYSHYKEKTSTQLGDLAEWVINKYDGDLNNLYNKETGRTRSPHSEVRGALKEIKGIGDVAVDIFMTSAQYLWTDLAPWIAPRSMETVSKIGIGTDNVDAIYAAVGKDPTEMCKLAKALEEIRLEKHVADYQ